MDGLASNPSVFCRVNISGFTAAFAYFLLIMDANLLLRLYIIEIFLIEL